MGTYIYIGAALVIGLLIGFVVLSIVTLRKTMLRNIRSHTLGLISRYDEILDEKSQKLYQLENEIGTQEEQSKMLAKNLAEASENGAGEGGVKPATLLAVAQRAAEASYRDASIGETYHLIKKNFSFSIEELLPVISGNNSAKNGAAGRLLSYLDFETVYQLSTLDEKDQLSVLEQCLPEDSKKLLEEYRGEHPEFSIFGFYDAMKSRMAEEEQEVRLYVPVGMAMSAASNGGAKVLTDGEICEGFQVEMGGKLYDYCIKAKELS